MSASFGSGLLLVAVYLALLASLIFDIVQKRRHAARERAGVMRIAELKRAVWHGTVVGGGVSADVGVLVARADRAARWARTTELAAVAAMLEAGIDIGKPGVSPTIGQADHALDAEAHLEKLLTRLRRLLPAAAGAELDASQVAFRDYRDAHVRLCRDLREGPDRMLVRDYASEAITRARISDLEDVLAIARPQE